MLGLILMGSIPARAESPSSQVATEWQPRIQQIEAEAKRSPARMVKLAREMESQLPADAAPSLQISLHLAVVPGLITLGNYDDAKSRIERTLKLAKDVGDDTAAGRALVQRATVFRISGNFESALEALTEAMVHIERSGDSTAKARILLESANVHRRQGRNEAAAQALTEAMQIARDTKNMSLQGLAHGGFGLLFGDSGRIDEAEAHLRSAIDIFRSQNERGLLSDALSNLAVSASRNKDHSSQIGLFEEVIALKRTIGDRFGEANALVNLASAHNTEGNYKEGLVAAKDAIAILEELEVKTHMAWALRQLAAAHCGLNEPHLALELLERALAVASEVKDLRQVRTTHQALADFYRDSRDFERALEHTIAAARIAQRISNDGAQDRLAVLENRFKTERKEREMAELRLKGEAQAAELRLRQLRQRELVGVSCALAAGLVAVGFLAANLRRKNRALGTANRELVAMAENLRATQAELFEASRVAGMAQIATSVLHEVGNTLNGVNVSVSVLADQIRTGSSAKVAKVADRLERYGSLQNYVSTDPHADRLPRYLAILGSQLATEKAQQIRELQALDLQVEQLKLIVRNQQELAGSGAGNTLATISVVEVVGAAERVCEAVLKRAGATISRTSDSDAVVYADRHKLLFILTSLIRNAAKAMGSGSPPDRTIRIASLRNAEGDVSIEVAHPVSPVSPQQLALLFAQDHSMKPDDYGFGLHASANAAQEMSGSLRVAPWNAKGGLVYTLALPAGRPDRHAPRGHPTHG